MNEPAFPSLGISEDENGRDYFSEGMTLRDYFAGQLLSNVSGSFPFSTEDCKTIAKTAYTLADAMLEEREK